MRACDIIARKRDGFVHSKEELEFFLNGYIKGKIGDEQMAAWLMAVYFQGLNEEETLILTDLMLYSGDIIDLSGIRGMVVDKHSTGGVGDKTTLVLAPLVAAAGVPVAKLSGRGLGFTGGTIDKLEAIPGFQTSIATDRFLEQVNEIGIAVAGQTSNLVLADKKMYALRDITATVESIPLIASSIMSKKLASGADRIVLDVKFGSGAFMQKKEDAEALARTMVKIGNGMGRNTVAVLSSMEEPLGFAVGNALEVQEAIDTLNGRGPADFTELCLTLAGQMIYLGEQAASAEEGRKLAEELLAGGKAMEKFEQMIAAQGGTLADGMAKAAHEQIVAAPQSGIVQAITARDIGHASMLLGAGRETKASAIDLSAGVVLKKKTGDRVEKGEPLAVIYYNEPYAYRADDAVREIIAAYTIADNAAQKEPLIWKIVSE
ncbi:MAG: pyrimidine-nucleoside phosphorylase [Peptococcaceae bacterium]|nr:pyrimidine-nucleoside phosphorylase [Peptococcaceae bacterium]